MLGPDDLGGGFATPAAANALAAASSAASGASRRSDDRFTWFLLREVAHEGRLRRGGKLAATRRSGTLPDAQPRPPARVVPSVTAPRTARAGRGRPRRARYRR